MLNQFYKYLAENLINFFESNDLKSGDKFFINFEEQNQVSDFYNALKEKTPKNVFNPFKYRYSHKYPAYNTFCIDFNQTKLIVTGPNVNVDFLVTLRNEVSKQDELLGYALLIIYSDIKDSIESGVKNLEEQGMPFNRDFISSKLGVDIKNSPLSDLESKILEVYLNNMEDKIYESTLWDYEDVLAIINKGFIAIDEYNKLDMFPDSHLENAPKNKWEKRIKKNNELYLEIEEEVQENKYEEYLEKNFDNSGIDKLKDKENWFNTDFQILIQSQENFNDMRKKINYLNGNNLFIEGKTKEGLVFWEKPKSETTSGKRKRDILIFNNLGVDKINLSFEFDRPLKRQFLGNNNSKDVSISNNILKLNINIDSDVIFKKYTYTHEELPKNKFEFNIAIINSKSVLFESIKYIFEIIPKFRRLRVKQEKGILKLGVGENIDEVRFEKNNQKIILSNDKTLLLNLDDIQFDIEDSLKFKLINGISEINFELKELRGNVELKDSNFVWNEKRISKTDFTYDNVNLIHNGNKYNIRDNKYKEILNLESILIRNKWLYAKYENDKLTPLEINLSDELKNAYNELFDFCNNGDELKLPSLIYLDDDLKKLYSNILEIFNHEIETIDEMQSLDGIPNKFNLMNIGVIVNSNNLLYSSISPINLAYQLELNNQCGTQNLDNSIIKRLFADNLVPYIYKDNVIYRPFFQDYAKEWLMYMENSNVSVGSTNLFLKKVVKEKLQQFVRNFDYLFKNGSRAPLRINLINIENDEEIVKGIFDFIRERLPDQDNSKEIIPIVLNIYNSSGNSSFEKFFECNDEKDLKDFGIDTVSSRKLDSSDVISMVQDNINYYKYGLNQEEEYEYAHISFYKFKTGSAPSDYKMSELNTGLMLNGLVSSLSSISDAKGYKVGFGIKNVVNEDNILVRSSKNINELAFNHKNNGHDLYEHGKSIMNRTSKDENNLNKLYDKSQWVTFIEPTFDLDFFDETSDLFIIHYSDQYSSSSQYDTITVTKKSEQYKHIIENFLDNYLKGDYGDEDIEEAIRIFNCINGEWLLRSGSNREQNKEKFSIISAIKYGLSILDNEDIIWVPISIEEILRVAGNIGLKKEGGLFSVKNLKGSTKGVYSDDLLFMGMSCKDELEVYFYPIEVKIGENKSGIISKAEKQVLKTANLINEELSQRDVDFEKKFYRNFFIQLFLSNAHKLKSNNIWDEKDYGLIDEVKKYLLNDEYLISHKLDSIIGKGAIISFKNTCDTRTILKSDDVLKIEYPSEDGFEGIIKSVSEINELILGEHNNEASSQILLTNYNISDLSESDDNYGEINDLNEEKDEIGSLTVEKEDCLEEDSFENYPKDNTNFVEDYSENPQITDVYDNIDVSKIRAYVGDIQHQGTKVYWEFGHSKLGNRHLFIQGGSGQGKTYLMQCLIKELSNQGIPSIIIDYNNAFSESELDNGFKNGIGAKIQYFDVFNEKFPINPFKHNLIDANGNIEDNDDVAERFVSTIESIFTNIGNRQADAIYEAILKAFEKYGDEIDLQDIGNELKQGDAIEKSAYSNLRRLINKNPFDGSKNFDWSSLEKVPGQINIIQVSSFQTTVKKIIIDIILCDLWEYKSRNGSKDNPFIVVLDECQNLDFKRDMAPVRKILSEGRKFGWSAWFATQNLKNADKNMSILLKGADEKIFFNPPNDEINDIAKIITNQPDDLKEVKEILPNLIKGSCVVFGNNVMNGQWCPPRYYVVNVTSFDKRDKNS